MYALALHEMLEGRKYSIESLRTMNASTFQDIQGIFGSLRFEGLTGMVRFEDQGDPSGLPGPDNLAIQYQYIEQLRSPAQGIFVEVGAVQYADKVSSVRFITGAELVFEYYNETLVSNGSHLHGKVADFPSCSGQSYNFGTMSCEKSQGCFSFV